MIEQRNIVEAGKIVQIWLAMSVSYVFWIIFKTLMPYNIDNIVCSKCREENLADN